MSIQPKFSNTVSKIHEAASEAERHDSNPTSLGLFTHLFGAPSIYRYEIVMTNKMQNPILRDKNIVLKLKLVDILTGETVCNKNRIHLQVRMQTWEIPSNNVTRNKNGNRAIAGQTEAELKEGNASFERLQVSEVSSKFMHGCVALAIIPCQPSNHGTYLHEDENDENFVNFEHVKPLLLEKIVVKSKKKVCKSD